MKIFIKIILLIVLAYPVLAQDDDAPVEGENHPKINQARREYINKRLKFSKDEAQRFWPIYDEFSGKRQELRKELMQARQSGKDETELVDLGLKLKQKELDLEKDYSKRLVHIITAEKMVQLRTAEKEFRRIIIRQIQQRQLQQQDRQNQIRDRQQQRIQDRNN